MSHSVSDVGSDVRLLGLGWMHVGCVPHPPRNPTPRVCSTLRDISLFSSDWSDVLGQWQPVAQQVPCIAHCRSAFGVGGEMNAYNLHLFLCSSKADPWHV